MPGETSNMDEEQPNTRGLLGNGKEEHGEEQYEEEAEQTQGRAKEEER
jgi:hypothetical protein